MIDAAARQGVLDLVAEADAAFAAGDAERYVGLFAEDALIALQFRSEPIGGRPAIADFWRGFFDAFDTSDWDQRVERIEGSGDVASVLATYTERLLDRATGQRELIRGRIVYWMRREAAGRWRISLIVNAQSHQPEPIP